MCPGCMYVPPKPHPFRNEYCTIACVLSKVIYYIDIVGGDDQPLDMEWKDFDKRGAMAGLIFWMSNPLWGTGKLVLVYTIFCDM